MKRGLDKVCKLVCEKIDNMSKPISSAEDVSFVAKISANNDKVVGDLVATAVDKVGKGGSVTIEDGRSVETTLDLIEGFRFQSGYLSNYFITDERRGVCRYEDALLFLCDAQVDQLQSILPVLEIAAREQKPLVIVSDNVEGQALSALIMNCARGNMKVSAVKSPSYGEDRRSIMEDLAIATGATYYRTMLGDDLSKVTINNLGTCQSIEVSKYSTIIVGGGGSHEDLKNRIDNLQTQIKDAESLQDAENLQSRVTRLSSGVAVIRVGAPTEVEMVEKKHRIEDALEAVRSAQQEGIVPGGGLAMYRISQTILDDIRNIELTEDQKYAAQIFYDVLRSPMKTMASNAGCNFDEIDSILSGESDDVGYNFLELLPVNMYSAGIIDPAKVSKNALVNAVSAAGTLLTTNYAIIEVD